MSQNILVAGKSFFKDELAEEATWGSQYPCHVHIANEQKMVLTFTPLKPSAKIGKNNILLPQQRRARKNLINPVLCPPRYEMQMAAQEFHNLHEPKFNTLKGGYSATASLIFQSWLKDVRVHVEDQDLMEREAIQLVKDFKTEHACDKVEFYMGMVGKDQQTFEGLVHTLRTLSSVGRP